MKEYRKKTSQRGYTAADVNAPIYFAYEANNDPQPDERVAVIYDRNGEYLGWATEDVVRKYIYGQLYYRTKKAYKIESARRRGGIKMIVEKSTGRVGLYIHIHTIRANEMVDMGLPGAKAKMHLSSLRGDFINTYTLAHGIADPYGYLESVNDEMHAEIEALCKKYQQRVIETLQSTIDAENALLDVAEMITERAI